MRYQWFACLLLAGLAYGQATAPAASPQKPAEAKAAPSAPAAEKPAEPMVNPGDPVITVKGVCDDPAKKGDDCKLVVTKEQFEKLADAIQPNMSPPIRRQLAAAYSRLLVMSREAEKRGLDKQPKFEEIMRFARMQILSQELTRDVQEESQKVSDSDIEKYYNDNKANYEEATLQRIFVPRTKQMPPTPPASAKTPGAKAGTAEASNTEAQQKAGEAAMKKVADELQARAAKGEDFDKLQKEAYLASGLKQTAPSTKMEKIRPNALPPTHKIALQMKPGAVTDVISDPSGYYIYKLVSKQQLPLDSVKQEIHNWVASQHYRDAMQAFQGNLDLNEAYFGPMRSPAHARPGQPPTEGDTDPD